MKYEWNTTIISFNRTKVKMHLGLSFNRLHLTCQKNFMYVITYFGDKNVVIQINDQGKVIHLS